MDLITEHAYLGIVTLLVLGALGWPIPEDVVIFAAGGISEHGGLNGWAVVLTCYATIFTTDTVVFFLGRRFGAKALAWPWVKRLLHPRRLLWFRGQVQAHGAWMITASRFLPGARGPTLLCAGMMRLSLWKYAIAEVPALLASIGIEFLAGYFVARSFADEATTAHRVLTWGLLAIGLAILGVFLLRLRRR